MNTTIKVQYEIAPDQFIEVEVNHEVYAVLEEDRKKQEALRKQDSRHVCGVDYIGMGIVQWLSRKPKPNVKYSVIENLVQRDIADDYEERNLCEEQLAELRCAIDQLSDVQKRRINAYFFDGLTHEQIAKMEGVTHSAVVQTLQNALKKLKKLFS